MKTRELPLWLWAAGYAEFVLHGVAAFPVGMLAIPAALALALLTVRERHRAWREELGALGREAVAAPATAAALALLAALFLLALWSAARPPFLSQEYDAINYQMGVPKQLLVRGSLGWIPWSVADLWPMAAQWGMAPFWFAFGTIQKLPQWLFAAGAAACLYRNARLLGAAPGAATLPMIAVLGSHGVALQLGTGMLDLPLLYFPLAAIGALLERRFGVAALALAVFTASKAFHPFLVGAAVALGLAWWRWRGESLRPVLTRFLLPLAGASLLLFARPALVSLSVTGTPLFPFAACAVGHADYCAPARRPALDEAAKALLAVRDSYGNGRGPVAVAKHLWRLAVPTDGAVNNEFDYPLGLSWLLLLVLGAFALINGGARRPLLGLAALFWLLWWLGAQQARWLYPTLAFGWLGTLPEQARVRRLLPALLAVGALFSLVSAARGLAAHRGLSRLAILEQERAKVKWAAPGKLESVELLYVDVPVDDHAGGSPVWVLR